MSEIYLQYPLHLSSITITDCKYTDILLCLFYVSTKVPTSPNRLEPTLAPLNMVCREAEDNGMNKVGTPLAD